MITNCYYYYYKHTITMTTISITVPIHLITIKVLEALGEPDGDGWLRLPDGNFALTRHQDHLKFEVDHLFKPG